MRGTPNLTLPENPKKNKTAPNFIFIFMVILQIAILAVVVLQKHFEFSVVAPSNPGDILKTTALNLEELNLHKKAADIWVEYIQKHPADAALYFRIAKLYQKSQYYQEAVDYYHRAEASQADSKMQQQIKAEVSECLSHMGRHNAMSEFLRQRSDIQREGKTTTKVLAKIGTKEITEEDLAAIIQQEIENKTLLFQLVMPQLNQQFTEQFKKQYESNEAKLQLLQEFLAQEVLWRKALENELQKTPDHTKKMQVLGKKLLANDTLQKEIGNQVVILPEEIAAYYNSHQQEYKQPAQAKLVVASFPSQEEAQAKLETIKSLDDFVQGLENKEPITINQGSDYLVNWGEVPELSATIFADDKHELVPKILPAKDKHLIFWVSERTPEKIRSFEEVQEMIQQILARQKSQKMTQLYLQTLFDKYQVEIYHSQLPVDNNGQK